MNSFHIIDRILHDRPPSVRTAVPVAEDWTGDSPADAVRVYLEKLLASDELSVRDTVECLVRDYGVFVFHVGLVDVTPSTNQWRRQSANIQPSATPVERGEALQVGLVEASQHLTEANRQISLLLDRLRKEATSGEVIIKQAMHSERQKCAKDLEEAIPKLPAMNLESLTAKGWLAVMKGEVPE